MVMTQNKDQLHRLRDISHSSALVTIRFTGLRCLMFVAARGPY